MGATHPSCVSAIGTNVNLKDLWAEGKVGAYDSKTMAPVRVMVSKRRDEIMKVHFGQWIDGNTPRLAIGEAVRDEVWVGPLGLLQQLEIAFGIDGQAGAEPERVDAYARRIEQSVGSDAFFSRSWDVDPWGVARELLGWRDELILAGWDGSAVEDGGPRLAALTAVEAESEEFLAAGFADRVRIVEAELESGRGAGVEELLLVEPRGLLPCAWQHVVELLEGVGTTIVEPVPCEPVADPETDLGLLQRALVEGTTLPAGGVKGDGSLLLMTGRSPWDAGEGLAAWLRQLELGSWPRQPALVRGAAPVVLDEALARYGVPTMGASSSSPWRPALQVLPLILAQLWSPRDPQRMLELLSLPVSPLPRRLRTALLRALGQAPGIGGPEWVEAWAGFAAASDEPEAVERQAREWLEWPVFDPSEGVPVSVVREVADRVADWARTRASVADNGGNEAEANTLATAAAQARQLSRILERRGDERLERTQLDQLLTDVTRAGSSRRVSDGLSGSVPCVSHPGAILGEADTVVWWGFVASSAGAARGPVWRAAERRALAAAGIEVDDPATQQRARTAAWLRPLLAARQRLLLVSFETLDGEVESPHPVWDEIRGRLRMSDPDLAALSADWRDALPSSGDWAHITLPGRPREMVSAAADRAVWAVDGSLLPPREKESASSLESLIGCPLRWGLNYRARLRSRVVELPEGNLLFGNLGHQLIEDFLFEYRDSLPEPVDARAMLEKRFDDIVEGQAASLLQPGQVETLERVRHQIARAGEVLVGAIRDGGFHVEGREVEISDGRFANAGFAGFIDLLLSHPQRGEVVVDLKWGGWTYRKKSLEEGRALQLALYGNAIRKSGQGMPPTAFFILSEARFLTLDHGLFDPAVVVEGPSMDETLAAAEATYGDVREELNYGELVAPPLLVEDLAEAREAFPMTLEAPCTFCDFGSICGFGLDGAS